MGRWHLRTTHLVRAYNKVKHDRAEKLSEATFLHVTEAWCALVAILTSQFLFEDVGSGHDTVVLEPDTRQSACIVGVTG